MLFRWLCLAAIVIALHLTLAPVPIDPVAWNPPVAPGYSGPHAPNRLLVQLSQTTVGDRHGPEDILVDATGAVYTGTEDGKILRFPSGLQGTRDILADTGGRPLGLALDGHGRLIVADAVKGLLRLDSDLRLEVLATEAEGLGFGFTNNVDVAADGKIYFTDASSKFSAGEAGTPYEASLLDLMEHGGNGRVLEYDPQSGGTSVLASGLSFANGIAVAHDQRSVLVNETGVYRVLRIGLHGDRRGEIEVLIDNLPGFPDNLTRGREGRYWLGLVAPRNGLLDRLGPHPFLRKVVQRLPAFLRPKADRYGHVIAIDDSGRVVADLQDPDGRYSMITSAAEGRDEIFVGSLTEMTIGFVSKESVGLTPSPERADPSPEI